MVTANKTSRKVWAYETVPGTSIITAVDSLSYEFGEYNEEAKMWNNYSSQNPVQPYWNYASRTPTLTVLERKFPTFREVYNPTTAIHLSQMLKNPSEGPPVAITTLDSGMTYPLTIRLEEKGGTVPTNSQAVGCYNVGLYGRMMRGSAYIVEQEFAWQSLEDIGDNVNLTTSPYPAGSGGTSTVTGLYSGNPSVTWNSNPTTPVYKAEYRINQEFQPYSASEGDTETVILFKVLPVDITLTAIFEDDDVWDDYIDRAARTLILKIYKANMTNYIQLTFTNTRVINEKKTGIRNKGHYESVATLLAEEVNVTSDFAVESSETFANHFKGVVV